MKTRIDITEKAYEVEVKVVNPYDVGNSCEIVFKNEDTNVKGDRERVNDFLLKFLKETNVIGN